MACTCDESFICGEHQRSIDQENKLEYLEEQAKWMSECLKLIAEKLGVKLPEEPKQRY